MRLGRRFAICIIRLLRATVGAEFYRGELP